MFIQEGWILDNHSYVNKAQNEDLEELVNCCNSEKEPKNEYVRIWRDCFLVEPAGVVHPEIFQHRSGG